MHNYNDSPAIPTYHPCSTALRSQAAAKLLMAAAKEKEAALAKCEGSLAEMQGSLEALRRGRDDLVRIMQVCGGWVG